MDENPKKQKQMAEGPVSVEEGTDGENDIIEVYSTHPFFKGTVAFNEKGRIIGPDSSEFYELLAPYIGGMKGTKMALKKIEKDSLGDISAFDNEVKEAIINNIRNKYTKIFVKWVKDKKVKQSDG